MHSDLDLLTLQLVRFVFMELLSYLLELNQTFEYVQSFEVGEHIDRIYEDGYFENLVKYA